MLWKVHKIVSLKKYLILGLWPLVLSLAVLAQGDQGKTQEELSEEDAEIIENLDFFENFDFLEEDFTLLEEYEDVEKFNEDKENEQK